MKRLIWMFLGVFMIGGILPPREAIASHRTPLVSQTIAKGLEFPTSIAFAQDGRIFVAEKEGGVKLIDNGTITKILQLPNVNSYADHGLLGIALDPYFSQNGYLYLSYTYENDPSDTTLPKTAQIVRVTVSGNSVDLGSMNVLVGSVTGDPSRRSCSDFPAGSDCIPSDSPSHTIGGLRFGPDGKLYASIGDGAFFFNVDEGAHRAQDLDSLSGKILRLNPDGTAPSDNPYFTEDATANRSKVWAYGFRNPYRFNFEPGTNRLFVADVGWYSAEELNEVSSGQNFGWPCREGYEATPGYNCTPSTGWIDPIYSYKHNPDPNAVQAITGGSFTGSFYFDELQGNYFFSDLGDGIMRRMTFNSDGSIHEIEQVLQNTDGPVDFVTAPEGYVHYVSIYTGEIRRIVPEGTPSPMVASPNGPENPPFGGRPTLRLTKTNIWNDPLFAGDQIYIENHIENVGEDGSALIDVEVYNANNEQVFQKFYDNSSFDAGSSEIISVPHIFPEPGRYRIALGFFAPQWGELYEWIDRALVVDVLPREPVTQPIDLSLIAVDAPSSAQPGAAVPINVTITNGGGPGSALIDIEVYDSTGRQVAQQFYNNDWFTGGESKTFQAQFTPPTADEYRIAVGIFRPDWEALHAWIADAGFITITGGSTEQSIIQDGNILSPWENWSWQTAMQTENNALTVSFQDPWAGLYLHTSRIVQSGTLELLFNGLSGAQQLHIFAFDRNGSGYSAVSLSEFISDDTLQTSDWHTVSIPLSRLGVHERGLSGFAIQGRNGSIQLPFAIQSAKITP